jgi:4-hydroxybenzoate polyprenyltransferase
LPGRDYIKLLRPAQWYKNALVFLAVVFYETPSEWPWTTLPAALNIANYPPLILGFIAFCLVSSATYIWNDIQDLEADAAHPEKRNRPLPSGKVSRRNSLILAAVLMAGGLILALSLTRYPTAGPVTNNGEFFILAILYVLNSFLYNHYLRKWAIVDVSTIAIGFIIRAISGAYLIGAPFTSWLVIGVFFFALILGFGKRKNELQYLGDDASEHKEVFAQYTPEMLDHGISMSATWFVVFYTIYCFNNFGGEAMQQQPVMLTVPFLAGVVLRYVYLIHTGSPVGRKPHLAFKDKGIVIGVILFLVMLAWTLFFWDYLLAYYIGFWDFLYHLIGSITP